MCLGHMICLHLIILASSGPAFYLETLAICTPINLGSWMALVLVSFKHCIIQLPFLRVVYGFRFQLYFCLFELDWYLSVQCLQL